MTRYLAVGAHPDDVEIGCGATLISLLRPDDELYYLAMSKCLDIDRNKERIINEWERVVDYLKNILPCKVTAEIFDFPNRRLFEEHMEIRKTLDHIRDKYHPNVVFGMSPKDLHQDHRYMGEETSRVFRECTLITYEIPRSVGIFIPNMYRVLSQDDVNKSIPLVTNYKSQSEKKYMAEDLIIGTLKHRGGEIGREYAQAFEVIRIVSDNENLF